MEKKYQISPDIVAREIEGEIIIVPVISGIGSMDDDLYTLNPTGTAVWKLLDKNNSIQCICDSLADEFDAPYELIKEQVEQLLSVLCQKGIVVEYS